MTQRKILPVVALVGLPNAGKSTLLNKIAGKHLAVTSEIAGTTRDRQYAQTVWNGIEFMLVDTAGLSLSPKDELETNVNKQIDFALTEADAVIFVVDGKEPKGAVDQSLVKKFRKMEKTSLLCVNKIDSPKQRMEKADDFRSLGIKPMFAVSAISGSGIGDMLDHVTSILAKAPADDEEEQPSDHSNIAVSIVGKPNVGKSSIFNKILNEERAVVSPIPGTTRTSVDQQININGIDFTFLDTAGLKKKEHRQELPDIFSGFQTFKAIRRSDVCLFVLDASEEITKQDQRVASEIFSMEKGCVVIANKSDLYKPRQKGYKSDSKQAQPDDKYKSLRDYISHHFPFLWMCPMFVVSALTGESISEAVAALQPIFERRNKVISGDILKEFLAKKLKINPPKLLRDQKNPKVFSLHQTGTNPPTFDVVVNHPAAISMQFRKFLENAIIKDLDFYGTPIKLRLSGKDKK